MYLQASSPARVLSEVMVASALRRRRHRHHHDPGLFGPLHRRANAFRIGGVEDDHIDFGGDKVIDLRHLLAQIVAAGDQRHFDVIPASLRASSSALW